MANPDVEKRIQAFPLNTLKVRGVSFLVRVDPETNEGYIMEEDGTTWTGKKAKIGKPPESSKGEKKDSSSGSPAVPQKEEAPEKKRWGKGGQKDSGKKMKPEKEPKKKSERKSGNSSDEDQEAKKKKALIVIALAAVAIVAIYFLMSSGVLKGNGRTSGGEQSTEKPLEAANVDELAAAENYEVLIVTKNMYPGDIITEADLTSFVINKVEYAQCGGAYPASCKGNVVGMQMKKFLPFGALLDYDSCTTGSDYTVAPWDILDDDHVYVDIPYVLDIYQHDNVIPGDFIRLQIDRDTKSSTPGSQENETTGEMGHTSQTSASITTDTFTFDNIQVIDFLTENRSSVFKTYSKFITLPEGFLASAIHNEITKENFADVEIHYLRIIVTKEQAAVIGSLPDDATRVSLSVVRSAPEIEIKDYNRRVSAINALLISRFQELQQEEEN